MGTGGTEEIKNLPRNLHRPHCLFLSFFLPILFSLLLLLIFLYIGLSCGLWRTLPRRFLSMRPIVFSLTRSMRPSSTTGRSSAGVSEFITEITVNMRTKTYVRSGVGTVDTRRPLQNRFFCNTGIESPSFALNFYAYPISYFLYFIFSVIYLFCPGPAPGFSLALVVPFVQDLRCLSSLFPHFFLPPLFLF